MATPGRPCYGTSVGSEGDFLQLFQHSPDVRAVAAGTSLFEVGEPGDVAYVVLSGQVEIQINGKAVETVGPGGIVGELALIDNEPRGATAIVVGDTTVAPVGERRFLFLVQHTPFFALKVMRVLAQRLRRQNVLR